MGAKWLFAALAALWGSAVQAGPQIQSWHTANGAAVYFVEARELPIVDVTVVFDAAGSRDGDIPGLAALTNGLLAEGAGDLSADAIAERFAELGVEFGNSSLRDMASVNLRSLSDPEKLQPAVELLSLILTRPSFPADGFDRIRNQMQVQVRLDRESPGKVVSKAYYAGLYPDHPYGKPPGGTEASLASVTRADVRRFHEHHYVGRNAVVAIVGDLDQAAAAQLATSLVGALPAGAPAPDLPAVPPLKEAVGERIEYPSTQTHLRMGQPGIARNDEDFYALYVGNHALGGGGLVSLLSDEVREKRGLSYSVYSRFSPMRRQGPFTIGLQTRNDQADTALQVARDTLRRFVTEGPTEQELKAAKQNITGGFPLQIDSNGKIVTYLAIIGFYDLPLDYLDRFTDRIDAVSREQVRDAFRRRVHPDRLLTILVGGQDMGAETGATAHAAP